MASKTNNKKRESNVILFPKRFSKGREQITERGERILEEFRYIWGEVSEIGKTALSALAVTENDMFADKVKTKRIAYSLLYINKIVEQFMEKLETAGNENDMEYFVAIIKSPAFSEMLSMACEQSRKGKDEKFRERYELITGEDGLAGLARSYNIKIKEYSNISKEDAGVDEIKKAKPDLSLPKSVSKKTVIEILTDFLVKGWDAELEKLMKIPQELFVKKGEGYFIFSEEEDSKAIKMMKVFFGGVGNRLIDLKAGYGLVIQESGSHTYASLIDSSRRIAVKAAVFSMHENESGWEEFKKALKEALKAAEKISKKDKKTFIVYDIDMLKKYDLSRW